MSTKSLQGKPGSRPRSFRVLALVASLSIAMAGLVGLGLAPAASAATPPVCPADTADTTWELQGNTCVGTTTMTADPVAGDSTYACPAGFLPDGPVEADTVCTRDVEKVQNYKCPSGYSTEDSPVTKDSVCTKEETKTSKPDKSKVCMDVQSDSSRGQENGDGCDNWEWVYTCPSGYQPEGTVSKDTTCTKTEIKEKSSVKDGKPYCPTAVNSSSRGHEHGDDDDDEGHGGKCTETAPPVETVHYFCPAGFSPEGEVAMNATCTKVTTEEQMATCPTEGDQIVDGMCVTPDNPVDPVAPAGGTKVYTATGSSSGSVDICLADGVTTSVINYSVKGEGSGPTQGDADYAANVATADAALANIAAQTPEGASTGACGAAPTVIEPPVVVNPAQPGTVPAVTPAKPKPATVAAPEAATVPAAVPAGGGSQAPALPIWALALVAVGIIGAAAAGKQLAGARK